MIKNMGNRSYTTSMCLGCKKIQDNCCRLTVQLTFKDIQRIKGLGYKLEDYAVLKEYKTSEIEDYDDWWKKSLIEIDEKFYKIVVKKDKLGDCYFLKDGEGCVLGKNRPNVCKIFPFWINKNGEVVYEEGELFCPLEKDFISVKESLTALKENEETIRGYYEAMKKENLADQEKLIELAKKLTVEK